MESPISKEPLLRQRKERKCVFPLEFPSIWDRYKKAFSVIWPPTEIDFSHDYDDFKKLDPPSGTPIGEWSRAYSDTQLFIITMLAFFSGADGIVNDNISENFSQVFNIPEIRCFYSLQETMENVHNETYALMIENLIRNEADKLKLFDAMNQMPGISRMYKWAQKWTSRTPETELLESPTLQRMFQAARTIEQVQTVKDCAVIWSTAKRIIAFSCVEGIMFSGPFAAIFWIKEKGILKGLTYSNELISRDEGMHTDFAVLLYGLIVNKPPAEEIITIIKEAVCAEQEFINSCLDKLVGMNKTDMSQYIEYTANRLALSLGYPEIYIDVSCPFPFMDKISFNGMTNFFERKVAEYSLSGFEDGHDDEITHMTDF